VNWDPAGLAGPCLVRPSTFFRNAHKPKKNRTFNGGAAHKTVTTGCGCTAHSSLLYMYCSGRRQRHSTMLLGCSCWRRAAGENHATRSRWADVHGTWDDCLHVSHFTCTTLTRVARQRANHLTIFATAATVLFYRTMREQWHATTNWVKDAIRIEFSEGLYVTVDPNNATPECHSFHCSCMRHKIRQFISRHTMVATFCRLTFLWSRTAVQCAAATSDRQMFWWWYGDVNRESWNLFASKILNDSRLLQSQREVEATHSDEVESRRRFAKILSDVWRWNDFQLLHRLTSSGTTAQLRMVYWRMRGFSH
jgi:hypothetical protein